MVIYNMVPVENVEFGKRMLLNLKGVDEIILQNHNHFLLWTHEGLIADEIVKMMEMNND